MKEYQVVIPPVVEDKIREQALFIAEDKPAVALDWYGHIFEKIDTLESMPERCPEAPESPYVRYTLRHLIIGEYRVLFRVVENSVRILDFKSGRQNKP